MSSFLTTVQLILTDSEKIPFLDDKLITLDPPGGTPLGYDISEKVMLKIMRLQTLCVLEEDRGEMPEFEGIGDQAREDPKLFKNALGIQEDSIKRVMMLEWLIVEVVREVYPQECDRLDVKYFLCAGKGIVWVPDLKMRFLD